MKRSTGRKGREPTLSVFGKEVTEGSPLRMEGSGWKRGRLSVYLGERRARIASILEGYPAREGLVPSADGRLKASIATYGLKPGAYPVRIVCERTGQSAEAKVVVTRRLPISPETPRPKINKPGWRDLAYFQPRFGHLGYLPPGLRRVQIDGVRRLREAESTPLFEPNPDLLFSAPNPEGCNWTPIGPAPIASGAQGSHPAEAGRVRAIAVDPGNPDRIYLGTAGGGVWLSEDGGRRWSPRTDYAGSLAIGAIAVDPDNPHRVFAGTGEYVLASPSAGYYGMGLLYSSDFGVTWTELAAATFERDEISRILFNPYDSANHMILSSSTGIYESMDGGVNWNLMRAGAVSDLTLIPENGTLTLLAGAHGSGIIMASHDGVSWSGWTNVTSSEFPTDIGRIVFGQCRNNPEAIYAAFGEAAGAAITGLARTLNGGADWSSVPLLPSAARVWGADYMLYVAVHPDDPDIIYLGNVDLYKTETAGASWDKISSGLKVFGSGNMNLHMDNHVMVFHPSEPETVYAGTDGGLYRSPDGGVHWEHLNHEASTLQCYKLGQHPQYENIAVVGMQDNGGCFYTGDPVWAVRRLDFEGSMNSMGGDVVFAEIDPHDTRYVYHGLYREIHRSTDGGQLWNKVHTLGSSATSEWLFPFLCDPHSAGVCYYGANQLFRSDDRALNWTGVTPALTGNITAIAMHPNNSNLLYVGTSEGKVYRVNRTGATWTTADVDTDDISENLPGPQYISSLAVEQSGAVWVAFASVMYTEHSGEFGNDHVYRLASSAALWDNRSQGLAQANPINSIVVDPDDDHRVFCGGDLGVFDWREWLGQWGSWDPGLPNSPVFHLSIHQPSRLIRAATFGRGVWERPLDSNQCPPVDLFVRDNILDSGRGTAPEGAVHPFDASLRVWHWQSADIRVDAPSFKTLADNPVDFINRIRHENPERDEVNRFYARVHNRGIFKATGVTLRGFFANASSGLPPLPSDFWTGSNPFNGNPTSTHWTPVGPARTIPDGLEAGETGVVSWDWQVPADAAQHSCLLLLTTCNEDALVSDGLHNVDELVIRSKHITLKNLHVIGGAENSGEGGGGDEGGFGGGIVTDSGEMEIHDPSGFSGLCDLEVFWGNLPRDAEMVLIFGRSDPAPLEYLASDWLEKQKIRILPDAERLFRDLDERQLEGIRERFDLSHYLFIPRGRRESAVVPELRLSAKRPMRIAFRLSFTPRRNKRVYQFDVVKRSGKRNFAGSSYIVDLNKQVKDRLVGEIKHMLPGASQYGLAIMALLMLDVCFVDFRP